MTKQRAFTLIEMMIVIALIAIIAGIALPNLSTFTKNSALSGASEELLNTLGYAKSEAIKQGSSITICNSANPSADQPTCISGIPNWGTGWIMFVDTDGDMSLDSGEKLLQITQAPKNVAQITVNNNQKSVRFRSVVLAGSSDTTFTFCNSGATERKVIIDKVGRIRREQGAVCS